MTLRVCPDCDSVVGQNHMSFLDHEIWCLSIIENRQDYDRVIDLMQLHISQHAMCTGVSCSLLESWMRSDVERVVSGARLWNQ